MNPPRGRFITFEGIDGAGKSTHVDWLAQRLREQGHTVVVTREPGGTGLGEALRAILLATVMDPETEALLMFAARAENLRHVIRPALAAGTWVISDRFTDATFAYQGAGKGIPAERLRILEQWVHADLQPDLTFLFDVDVTTAQTRLQNAREPDKFERENAAFFERVRNGYRQRAQEAPSRIRIIGGDQAIETIRKQLEDYILTI